jgi:hypothetical protein
MDRKTHRFQPQTTELESKLLLSVASTRPAEVSSIAQRGRPTSAAVSANAIQGRYFAAEDNRAADAPLHVQLTGNGRLNGAGKVDLSGSLDLGGFSVAGSKDVRGTLTLSNAKGAVTIQLTGSGGSKNLPNNKFVTTVSAVTGTGAYRGIHRRGTATFQFGANQVRSFVAPSPIGGTMSITLSFKSSLK